MIVLLCIIFFVFFCFSSSQVHIVPHTPYSKDDGSSIALFLIDSQQRVVKKEEFFSILLNHAEQLRSLVSVPHDDEIVG